jgi:hypothetical protein
MTCKFDSSEVDLEIAENSSPEALRDMAKQIGHKDVGGSIEEQRRRVAAFLEQTQAWPSQAQLLQSTLTIVSNSSESDITRIRALELVQELVEQVDLANGV